jgi:nitrogen fixation/metabolism regulation signal transduction histidine kinase
MTTTPSEAPPRRHHRSVKNYLLDRHFQLKYAGILFGVAGALSLALGFLLYRTSKELVTQSQQAVASGQQAVTLAQQVAAESEKVSAVVRMNIVQDPTYKDNPELIAAFQAEQKKEDATMAAQQEELRDQAERLATQAGAIGSQQRTMLIALFVLLGFLVVGVGLAGIVVTHKVAGPIFKMTRQIQALGQGSFRLPSPLRKGDELADFFGAFETTVKKLRAQREKELALLAQAKESLEEGEARARLEELESELARALEASS